MNKIRAYSAVTALLVALSGTYDGPLSVVTPVHAASKEKVSAKVGKPLQQAQELMKKKKFSEAMAKVKEADAVSGKSDYDNFQINEFAAFININLKNYPEVLKAYTATLDSPYLDKAEQTKRMKVIAQLNYQMKDYAKAAQAGQRYIKAAGNDNEMQLLIGQAFYLQHDYANAAKSMRDAVAAAAKAGSKPKREWLALIMSSEFEQKNNDGLASALEEMLTYYPSPDDWAKRLQIAEQKFKGSTSNTQILQLYRLKLATGTLSDPAEYVELAELALEQGYPGEAQAALEKGIAAGVIKPGGEKDRNTRLLNTAKAQAVEDQKSLAQSETDTAKAPTGDPQVKLGEAYLSYGQYDKAIAAIQAGLAKGKVKYADEAQLSIGQALLAAGKKDEAKKAFAAPTEGSLAAELGHLWTIFADHGAGSPAAAAASAQ